MNNKINLMKKYQLLEKAMRDYPAGTLARFKSAPNVDHTSDGIFRFCDFNQDGKLHIVSGEGSNCFYSDGEWAIPVPASILSGKVAIQVNNEREFKLLMEHYESKGWLGEDGTKPTECMCFYGFPVEIEYSDSMTHGKFTGGYKIITFSDFAKEVGIDIPVFVMKSEDGVDLYKGDIAHHACKHYGRFIYNYTFTVTKDTINGHVFSTQEAAQKWVEEQNRPKTIDLFNGHPLSVRVGSGGITLWSRDDSKSGDTFHFSAEEIRRIYEAYQSLQEDAK